MKPRFTLINRFVIFLTIVVVSLVGCTLLITSRVVKGGLVDLFAQRIELAREVLKQYHTVHYYTRAAGFQAVLSSPRFLAAVETADSSTIANEVPTYMNILGNDALAITDTSGAFLYCSDHIAPSLELAIRKAIAAAPDRNAFLYVVVDSTLMEMTLGRIINNSGHLIGWLATTRSSAPEFLTDLQRLTGFDVVISRGDRVLGHTAGSFVAGVITDIGRIARTKSSTHSPQEGIWNNREIIYTTVTDTTAAADITFLASLDEHIAPIQRQILLLLVIVTATGGGLAIGIVAAFTKRRIGRQIDNLVQAADRIAAGQLDRAITSLSTDELGYLTSEFERMRVNLVKGRQDLELAHQQRLTAERLAAVGNFATGIIHDFKNPMSIVQGTVELLQRKADSHAGLDRACRTITEQIDRMTTLTRDVLEFSRGRTILDLQEVDLSDYLRRIASAHKEQYEGAGLKMSVDGPLDIRLTLDPVRFRRVLDNILNNAREALSTGGVTHIRWRRLADSLEIKIEDNGPGIPPEIVKTVFDPFVTSNKKGGTGLGLAITKKIVEDHGASIAVASEPGSGTWFTITFPIGNGVPGSTSAVQYSKG